MTEQINLKEIESKAWRSVFQDGIWDIYLGLLLLAMGASSLMDKLGIPEFASMSIYIPLMVVSMLLLWAGKRFITLPRMGRVRFGQPRRTRRYLAVIVLFASVLFGMVMWLVVPLLSGTGLSKGIFFPAIFSLNMLVVFGLGAYLFQYDRLYLIAVLYAITMPLDYFIQKTWNVDLGYLAFGIPALIIILVGGILLAKFMREHPVLKAGE